MPPQPKVDLGSLEAAPPATGPLLPDLFDRGEGAESQTLQLKGRLFVQPTDKENLDAIDGGQIIMEMKTR